MSERAVVDVLENGFDFNWNKILDSSEHLSTLLEHRISPVILKKDFQHFELRFSSHEQEPEVEASAELC